MSQHALQDMRDADCGKRWRGRMENAADFNSTAFLIAFLSR